MGTPLNKRVSDQVGGYASFDPAAAGFKLWLVCLGRDRSDPVAHTKY